MKQNYKAIRVAMKKDDDTKVKTTFSGGIPSPFQFGAMIMAILDSYTLGLLQNENNKEEDVFNYYNEMFGKFLNRIIPEDKHYELNDEHKAFKEKVDSTLGRKLSLEELKDTEEVRMASYLLCGDILTNELGLTPESADLLLNKRLNLIEKIETPKDIKKDEEEK